MGGHIGSRDIVVMWYVWCTEHLNPTTILTLFDGLSGGIDACNNEQQQCADALSTEEQAEAGNRKFPLAPQHFFINIPFPLEPSKLLTFPLMLFYVQIQNLL